MGWYFVCDVANAGAAVLLLVCCCRGCKKESRLFPPHSGQPASQQPVLLRLAGKSTADVRCAIYNHERRYFLGIYSSTSSTSPHPPGP